MKPPQTIPGWPRRQYAGPGPTPPLLYYRVYGRLDLKRPLDAHAYRCRAIPNGISLRMINSSQNAGTMREILDPPLGDILRQAQPQLDDLIAESTSACIILGSPVDDSSLDYFRDTIGLITWLLDGGGALVYDPLQLRCWSAVDWRREVFDLPAPDPLQHCVVLVSEDETPGRRWFHTRGLRKFGRPDVSVRAVPPEAFSAVAELCESLIVMQVEGAIVSDGALPASPGFPKRGEVRTLGSVDDPDFNNLHLEVTFPIWAPMAS